MEISRFATKHFMYRHMNRGCYFEALGMKSILEIAWEMFKWLPLAASFKKHDVQKEQLVVIVQFVGWEPEGPYQHSKIFPLRTRRRALSVYKVYGDSALLVLNGTSMNSDGALLALSGTSMNSDSALLALRLTSCNLADFSAVSSENVSVYADKR